jgi:hypothetical protein
MKELSELAEPVENQYMTTVQSFTKIIYTAV